MATSRGGSIAPNFLKDFLSENLVISNRCAAVLSIANTDNKHGMGGARRKERKRREGEVGMMGGGQGEGAGSGWGATGGGGNQHREGWRAGGGRWRGGGGGGTRVGWGGVRVTPFELN